MKEETYVGVDVEESRDATASLDRLNALSQEEAREELLKCCGSAKWAERAEAERPFESVRELLETADRAWWDLDREDWLEAFRSHPKIGGQKAERSVSRQATRWSEEEQSSARGGSPEIFSALAEANREYEDQFGFIFIVCATGKTSDEMLANLRERLGHDTDAELRVAAEEQRLITHLRLRKLLQA
ncbi:MAG: 2-oxo-4-hydroxy-4-carboxy-5-ureidoimidazoline decarboxylase [Acidobacteria bacterium]|nr:2-oxo-4-hydroxy-4-carboxy-5-ureidoimidazoline decarboxylase [Acidobacteriota bacterium]